MDRWMGLEWRWTSQVKVAIIQTDVCESFEGEIEIVIGKKL